MAEDFAEQFALGDDEHIATVDADGVAFAAIQALAEENAEQADTIDELQAQNEDLRQRCDEQAGTIADLRDRNAELETAIDDLRADIDARLETIESRIDSANSD
jgi:peptidoglycan hydrolase CwlO-like protein